MAKDALALTKEEAATVSAFGLFVRAKAGHVVARFGSLGLIGARRVDTKDELGLKSSGWTWDEKTVHAISKLEAAKFRREYARALREKALVESTSDDFVAQLRAEQKAAAEAATKTTKKAEG